MKRFGQVELGALCVLLMCDDPTDLTKLQRESIESFADAEAQRLGYKDWSDALHNIDVVKGD